MYIMQRHTPIQRNEGVGSISQKHSLCGGRMEKALHSMDSNLTTSFLSSTQLKIAYWIRRPLKWYDNSSLLFQRDIRLGFIKSNKATGQKRGKVIRINIGCSYPQGNRQKQGNYISQLKLTGRRCVCAAKESIPDEPAAPSVLRQESWITAPSSPSNITWWQVSDGGDSELIRESWWIGMFLLQLIQNSIVTNSSIKGKKIPPWIGGKQPKSCLEHEPGKDTSIILWWMTLGRL